MTPNCNALVKLIISYLWINLLLYICFSWQCKTMLFTNKKTCKWCHRSVRI